MARHVLIRDGNDVETVVEETELPAEKDLHDVLTQHPELIPANDLEIGRAVVVGRESGLDSGYADLVLVDSAAQICLVEVKKAGNPDTRRVIAQLLDYAAALWQMSADTFESDILWPYLRKTGVEDTELPGLAGFVAETLASDSDADEGAFEEFPRQLEQSLTSGKFRLVVAAPSIPSGVQQAIEYLNSQGLLIYGLEVGFFSGPAECFVPHLVVKPRVTETRKLAAASAAPIAEEDFLQSLPDEVHDIAAAFLRRAEGAGARIRWNASGPSIRAAVGPERVVAWLESKRVALVIKPPNGYPATPFDETRAATVRLGAGRVSSDEWYWNGRFEELSDEQLDQAFDIAIKLIESLEAPVEFEPVDPPIVAVFQRNDHNIWAKSVGPLQQHVGQWLRGTLQADGGPAESPVMLEPLAGGSPGWKPRLGAADDSTWPPGELNGNYTLKITEAGAAP